MICGVNKRVERGNWVLAVSTEERSKILLFYTKSLIFKTLLPGIYLFKVTMEIPEQCVKSVQP